MSLDFYLMQKNENYEEVRLENNEDILYQYLKSELQFSDNAIEFVKLTCSGIYSYSDIIDQYFNAMYKKYEDCECKTYKKLVLTKNGEDIPRHDEKEEVFSSNITHNLGKMADKCGVYDALWRPDENGYKYAKDIIDILEKGYNKLISKPTYYKKFDSENGWGTYVHFVPFVYQILEACKQYPNSEIYVSR